MKAIKLLKETKADLINKAKSDSSLSIQIADISDAIKRLEFCEKYEISHKDEVLEVEALHNYGYTKLVKYTDDDEPNGDYCIEGMPVELTGCELIIKRRKYEI